MNRSIKNIKFINRNNVFFYLYAHAGSAARILKPLRSWHEKSCGHGSIIKLMPHSSSEWVLVIFSGFLTVNMKNSTCSLTDLVL